MNHLLVISITASVVIFIGTLVVNFLSTPITPSETKVSAPLTFIVEEINVDLGKCEKRDYQLLWQSGSENMQVRGGEGGQCIFQLTSEVAGDYTINDCRIPASGSARISKTSQGINYSFNVTDACTKIRSGNVIDDLPPLPGLK